MESIKLLYSDKKMLHNVRKRARTYPPEQVLIQVFCGITDIQFIRQLQRELIRLFPDNRILGVTTAGEIYGRKLLKQSVVIDITLFDKTTVTTFAQPVSDEMSLTEAGTLLRQQIEAVAAQVAIVFSAAYHNKKIRDDNEFVEALTATNNGVTIAGGLAGVESLIENDVATHVFTEHRIIEQGSVAATFYGEGLKHWMFRCDGWVPIGRKMQITKVEGKRVYTVDNLTIKDIYQRYLNRANDMSDIYQAALEFPLMYDRNNLRKKNVPLKIHDDGSFEFMHQFYADEWVQFCFCDLSLLQNETTQIYNKIKRIQPEAVFIVSCQARKHILGNYIPINSRNLELIASTAGYFSGSEYFTNTGGTHCMIQNMAVLALSENELALQPTEAQESPAKNDVNQRTVDLLFTLTHLISVTSQELNESQQKLQQMARVDNLTGLYNRGFFDHQLSLELKHCCRTQSPLSLIMMDIDYFKQFNDRYGHVAGDECLIAIAALIKQALHRSTDIGFRYGGEELGCLLPATDQTGALAIAERLQQVLKESSIEHDNSAVAPYVTMSMGVVTCQLTKTAEDDPKILIKQCDKLLYQAKEQGRNRIISSPLITELNAEWLRE